MKTASPITKFFLAIITNYKEALHYHSKNNPINKFFTLNANIYG